MHLLIAPRRPAAQVRSRWQTVWLSLLFFLLLLAPTSAFAQQVEVQLDSREVHSGMPFTLSVAAQGFDESPEPEASTFSIDRCQITPLGVEPRVETRVQIIQGRRSESRRVTFVFRYRVVAETAGTFTIPAITVEQGSKSASTRAARFEVKELSTTKDMLIRLNLPERPVWVGETFGVTVDWLLRKDVSDQVIVVPLFEMVDNVRVTPADAKGRKALELSLGTRQIQMPFSQDKATIDGVEYTRVRLETEVTPIRAGTLSVDPTRVVAKLQVGMGRDSFGFRVARGRLFKAEDTPRTLEVRALPLQGRPPSFENAVGTAFSVRVQAKHTVVRVGDPIELSILVRGDGQLEGLRLPQLDGEGGLDPELFSVPDQAPIGQVLEDENGKAFSVTIRLKGTAAREIPALPFSYFNPEDTSYHTVHTDPIALSVEGSATVGADDVVREGGRPGGPDEAGKPQELSLVGADLSLSDEGTTLHTVMMMGSLRPFVYGIYGVALLLFGGQMWRVRTASRRGKSREVRDAVAAVERELASQDPARESAPRLVSSLRALGRVAGHEVEREAAILERIETEAFSPSASDEPLADELRDGARELVKRWARETDGESRAAAASTAVLLIAATFATVHVARADDSAEQLTAARATYTQALAEQDRARRTRGFAQAESAFRALADSYPDRPDLLADWGNAALGAQDIGHATLAYRRALAIDTTHKRARTNLSWLRSQAPSWLPQPAEESAIDSLLAWHEAVRLPTRHIIAALALALLLGLLAPWSTRRVLRRRLALVPLTVWLLVTGSLLVEPNVKDDAVVVVDGVELRSADSLGAPRAFPNPLVAGVEVTVVDTRENWTRVAMADGTTGWLQAHAAQRVVPADQ